MDTVENVTELIKAVQEADSAQGLLDAVRTLAATGHEEAIPTLIEVLGYNNPGAAVAAVDGLIELGEVAVPHLLEQIDGYNYGARAWATRALAFIGDPRALDLLIEAASSDFSLSVRRAAAKGLGTIRWSKLPIEAAIRSQAQVFETLLQVLQDPEWIVRYAAVVGLQSFAQAVIEEEINYKERMLEIFSSQMKADPQLAVRVRLQMALQELGKQGNGKIGN